MKNKDPLEPNALDSLFRRAGKDTPPALEEASIMAAFRQGKAEAPLASTVIEELVRLFGRPWLGASLGLGGGLGLLMAVFIGWSFLEHTRQEAWVNLFLGMEGLWL